MVLGPFGVWVFSGVTVQNVGFRFGGSGFQAEGLKAYPASGRKGALVLRIGFGGILDSTCKKEPPPPKKKKYG